MRVAVFSTKSYDQAYLEAANHKAGHALNFLHAALAPETAQLARGADAVCAFVNDDLSAPVIESLAALGVRFVALRCAGYNNVDLSAARERGVTVMRVPGYSPHSVAEFTIGLLLALQRHIPRAWARVRDDNFALDGLIGRDLHGQTVGVVGTGRIGGRVARTLKLGFGCEVLASDPVEDASLREMGVEFVDRNELLRRAQIVTLHCPLTPETHHVIDGAIIEQAQPGLVIVNTSRGALIDSKALIGGLKSRKIGGVALDVYEQEADLFFEDLSNQIIADDVFQRLLTFPNVLITGHQAFLTQEALSAIAQTTLANLSAAENGAPQNVLG